MSPIELHAGLEGELPRLEIGRGNALLVGGWCYHPAQPLRQMALALDGVEHPVLAHSVPRADGHRSGFCGILPIRPRAVPAALELEAVVLLRDRSRARRPLGVLEVEPGSSGARKAAVARPEAAAGEPLICICMATCNPPAELLRVQLDSLRAQRDARWVCVIADDCSQPERLEEIHAAIDGDRRFELREHGERLGAYRNFERALRLAPAEAELICFCDQDDRWHPDKLATLRAALAPGATLAFSDMRVVDSAGNLISPTYWSARANNFTNLADLVMVNTVTGAASLFRRSLLDDALPFPEPGPDSFHDHWLAVVALATGRIAYVDRPLHDYVQHPDAALGHELANLPQIEPSLRERIVHRSDGERLARWRRDYPYLLRVLLTAEILWLRCADRLQGRKRRQVERLLALGRAGGGFGWLGWRALRTRPEAPTMGKERQLLRAKLWQAAVSARPRGSQESASAGR